jgi:hypothetical protein
MTASEECERSGNHPPYTSERSNGSIISCEEHDFPETFELFLQKVCICLGSPNTSCIVIHEQDTICTSEISLEKREEVLPPCLERIWCEIDRTEDLITIRRRRNDFLYDFDT